MFRPLANRHFVPPAASNRPRAAPRQPLRTRAKQSRRSRRKSALPGLLLGSRARGHWPALPARPCPSRARANYKGDTRRAPASSSHTIECNPPSGPAIISLDYLIYKRRMYSILCSSLRASTPIVLSSGGFSLVDPNKKLRSRLAVGGATKHKTRRHRATL